MRHPSPYSGWQDKASPVALTALYTITPYSAGQWHCLPSSLSATGACQAPQYFTNTTSTMNRNLLDKSWGLKESAEARGKRVAAAGPRYYYHLKSDTPSVCQQAPPVESCYIPSKLQGFFSNLGLLSNCTRLTSDPEQFQIKFRGKR